MKKLMTAIILITSINTYAYSVNNNFGNERTTSNPSTGAVYHTWTNPDGTTTTSDTSNGHTYQSKTNPDGSVTTVDPSNGTVYNTW